MDNLFIKRLLKRVKYEDVYLKTYSSPGEMRKERKLWYDRYNTWRRHQGTCNSPLTYNSIYGIFIKDYDVAIGARPRLRTSSRMQAGARRSRSRDRLAYLKSYPF
jgi:hypothetical protein